MAEPDAAALETPRTTFDLVGHDAAQALVLDALNSGHMPHAWLITGPRGVGKATLAFRIARFLLAHGSSDGAGAAPQTLAVDPDHPAVRRISAGSHADLLVLERPFLNERGTETADLNIFQVRRIAPFLHMTSAEGAWRVVIIDEADALNTNSANAILKIVEEPPNRVVVLLLADRPGGLLPTIRSRCRRLTLNPLSQDALAAHLLATGQISRPDQADALAGLAGGCIGRALSLQAGGGVELHARITGMLDGASAPDWSGIHGLADTLAAKGADDRFALAVEMITDALADRARSCALEGQADGLERWVAVWEKTRDVFAGAVAANLDRRQVILQVFGEIRAASRG